MNKRAQVDQIISSLFVLFIIFFLMLGLVLISIGISLWKSGHVFDELERGNKNDFLIAKIKVVHNEEEKEMRVIDAFIKFKREEIKKQELGSALEGSVKEDNVCVFLTYGKSEEEIEPSADKNWFYYRYYDGLVQTLADGQQSTAYNLFREYNEEGHFAVFSYYDNVLGESEYIASYHGMCRGKVYE